MWSRYYYYYYFNIGRNQWSGEVIHSHQRVEVGSNLIPLKVT